ncbi:MAG: hypothetical protein ABI551_17255, partial [Polyangiaceae bacterium]
SPRTRAAFDAGPVDPAAEAAKLVPFLPARLGAFAATGPAMPVGILGPVIEARRAYTDASGRDADVRLATGDVSADLGTLDSDDEHAFGSDTPTYWRTTAIGGHRTRIGEERPTPRSSTCVVRVGPSHIADVWVSPVTTVGECAKVAALLDFAGIAASGGVPGPPAPSRR